MLSQTRCAAEREISPVKMMLLRPILEQLG
jgi:hypothetical protein